jgi:glycerol-3-phosphate dehydrogenase (NAD(P)+)
MNQKILIIGNGKIGQAIYHLLKSNPSNKTSLIEIYDKDNSKNKSCKTLKECASNKDFIFLCIPSWGEEEVLLEIKQNLNLKTILIPLSKGINVASRKSMDELIEEGTKKTKYALLSGPMFAFEIIEGKMSYAVLASKEKSVFIKVSKLFAGTKLKLEYQEDVHSVALSAVLKNIYTLGIGIIEGSGERNNTKGFLSALAIKEMLSIAKILKLNNHIVLGTAGVADFIATSGSEHSQNRRLGKEIYEQGCATFKSEGFVSLSSLLKILGKNSKKFLFLSLIERIIINKKDAKLEMEKFFKRI